jgi:hypothetical protein
MIAVAVMQVPADQIIDVIAVRNRGMPAIFAVLVPALMLAAAVAGRASLRIAAADADAVLFHPIAADVLQTPILEIIDVAFVPHGGVPAIGTMNVPVFF